MFKEEIWSTPYVDDYANETFGLRIMSYTTSSGPDMTFLSTLRALVYPRLGEGDAVFLQYRAKSFPLGSSDRDVLRILFKDHALEPGENAKGCVIINHIRQHGDVELAIQALASQETDITVGWHRVEKVTAFFHKAFWVDCYINPDLKSVLVFADLNKTWKFHYLQCAIPVFLPWYFGGDKALTPAEMELIESLREKTPDKYEDTLKKLAEQYNFREERIKRLLDGFETRFVREQITQLENEIANIIAQINSYYERIGDYTQQKRDANIRLMGLQADMNSNTSNSELMDFFIGNKRLVLKDVNQNRMVFYVKDYLSYWDEEAAKTILDNPNSYFYKPNGENCSGYIKPGDMRMLLKAIFVEQTLRVKMCAAYELRLGRGVRALSHYSYGSEANDHTPNPHIDQYSCLGGYESAIAELVQRNDYIGAVVQCIASCQSLNIMEAPTMNVFMGRLYKENDGANVRCIELPDGRVVKPKEAINYLKAEKEKEGNEQTD